MICLFELIFDFLLFPDLFPLHTLKHTELYKRKSLVTWV